MERKAEAYLVKNREQNLPAIYALMRGAQPVVCEEGGVILYDAANELYYISLSDNALLQAWRHELPYYDLLVLREGNIEAVRRHVGVKIVNPCRQVIFLGEAPAMPNIEGLAIASLTAADLDFVCDHYKMHLHRNYMKARLEAGDLFGAYYRGALAGFAGRHSDGSVGMLEVLPEYRRLGIGSALGCHVIRLVKSLSQIPYAHIFPDNGASLAMTGQLPGATFTDELVAWMA